MVELDLHMTEAKRLGAELRGRREDLHLSQDQVSARLGVSQNWVSYLELGKVDAPAPEALFRLAQLYGLTPNWIAERAGWWEKPDRELPSNLDAALELFQNLDPDTQDDLARTIVRLINVELQEQRARRVRRGRRAS
jgi:transcriptional regulator with XRE-family HTH domain